MGPSWAFFGASENGAPAVVLTQGKQRESALSDGFRHSDLQRIGSGWVAMIAVRERLTGFGRRANFKAL
jgi:hypothetical protein